MESRWANKWTKEEDERLLNGIDLYGLGEWKKIAEVVQTRDQVKCLQRWERVLRPDLVKGKWTPEEDKLLICLVSAGYPNWGKLAAQLPGRTSKQCRERWCHYLDPTLLRTEFTSDEDRLIVKYQNEYGNKWAKISRHLPGRTENSVKLRFQYITRHNLLGDNNPAKFEKLRKFTAGPVQYDQINKAVGLSLNKEDESEHMDGSGIPIITYLPPPTTSSAGNAYAADNSPALQKSRVVNRRKPNTSSTKDNEEDYDVASDYLKNHQNNHHSSGMHDLNDHDHDMNEYIDDDDEGLNDRNDIDNTTALIASYHRNSHNTYQYDSNLADSSLVDEGYSVLEYQDAFSGDHTVTNELLSTDTKPLDAVDK